MKFRWSTVVYGLAVLSVLARLLLSNWLLDSWYPYSAEGGAPYQKVHPGTVLALLAVFVLASAKGPFAVLHHLWRAQRPATIYMACILLVSLVTSVAHGTSGAAYLIDTFLAAGCYPVLFAFLRYDQVKRVATVVLGTVALNSALAVAEYIAGYHLLPQPYSFGFFRASALLGHPLANGLITATCMVASLAMEWTARVKLAYVALLVLSLFAFGARGALLVSVLALAVVILALPHVTRVGRRNREVLIPASIVGVPLLAVALAAVAATDFGFTIASRLSADDSTGARVASLDLLRQFSLSETVVGVPPAELAYLLDLAGVPIVENFWVALLLRIGIPLLALLVLATIAAVRRHIRDSSFFAKLTPLVFVAVASTNNSLATKSCALVVLLVLLAGISSANFRHAQRGGQCTAS